MIRHFYVCIVLCFFLTGNLSAQTDTSKVKFGWKKSVVGNLNFTQNQFDNWTGGGEDSWAWQTNVDAKFNLNQERYKWTTSGKLTYGKTKLGDASARKSADEIRLESVYAWKLALPVAPYAAATAMTQLTPGYQYLGDTAQVEISNFLDPGYFTQSIGLDYNPTDQFSTRLGAALKETVTDQHPIPYADDPETSEIEEIKVELGVTSVTDMSIQLNDIILFTSRLDLFSDLEAFNRIDVDWDNTFSAGIAKYLNVNFNFRLYYDRDLSQKRQIKQTLSVGLTYSLL